MQLNAGVKILVPFMVLAASKVIWPLL